MPQSGHRGRALPDRLLDVNEGAALLAVKLATLYQWAYQRRLPVVKLFGRQGGAPIPRERHPSPDRHLPAARTPQERRPGAGSLVTFVLRSV